MYTVSVPAAARGKVNYVPIAAHPYLPSPGAAPPASSGFPAHSGSPYSIIFHPAAMALASVSQPAPDGGAAAAGSNHPAKPPRKQKRPSAAASTSGALDAANPHGPGVHDEAAALTAASASGGAAPARVHKKPRTDKPPKPPKPAKAPKHGAKVKPAPAIGRPSQFPSPEWFASTAHTSASAPSSLAQQVRLHSGGRGVLLLAYLLGTPVFKQFKKRLHATVFLRLLVPLPVCWQAYSSEPYAPAYYPSFGVEGEESQAAPPKRQRARKSAAPQSLVDDDSLQAAKVLADLADFL